MDKARQTLKISLVVIIASLIVSIFTSSYIRVKRPVFIENYCQYEVVDYEGQSTILGQPFVLQYIDNGDSKRKAITIEFKGYEHLSFNASEFQQGEDLSYYNSSQSTVKKVGPYGIHNIYVTIPDNLELENWEDIRLSEAKIGFDDGTSINVNLGNIVLYKLENTSEKLEMVSSTSSDGSEDKTILRANDDITINKVVSLKDSNGSDLMEFKIINASSDDKSEKNYKADENVYIKSIFVVKNDILSKLARYELKGDLYYTDSKGKEYIYQIWNVSNFPDYNFKDIVKYLYVRGEL